MKSFQTVAKLYIDILVSMDVEPMESPCTPFRKPHLLWMLIQIRELNLSSDTKSHRWLGYVQGIMCYEGIITVDDQRNITRGIFNGE
jgi:hypothetical protein